ncbi:MAG: asparagine synthase (glutamine-hydrolyzing) [Clostridia bacterium]|nr:asparagine synthase (glutamine-hydrolyzing) [Clostridia bacterium]
MCSICGFANFERETDIDSNIIDKMGQKLKHRGPDTTEKYVDKYVSLHHNRLSVIDIENGKQPMSVEYMSNKYVIIYNGEIYNTPELKQQIYKDFKVEMKTNCDTEVVLWSYILYKEKCPEMLNGIFAFAVYDTYKKQLFIARDRFGIKPLFYTVKNGTLIFASEIKAMLEHPEIKPEIDIKGLWQLLYLSPVKINGNGIFKDISEIKPGYCGVFDKSGLKFNKYWKLKAYELNVTSREAAEHTKFLLTDAIKRQLVSDVPLCVFLSGGLDSSVISAVAAEEYKKENKTLSSYSFEYEGNKTSFKSTLFQPQGDDEYAVYLAEYLGTNHTILTAPTESVVNALFDATKHRDFPGQADIDSSLLYFCNQVKKNHTVAISGECSDEIFGGYPWFYRPEMLYKEFFPWIHDPYARIRLFDDGVVHSKDGYEYISSIYKNSINECPIIDGETDDMRCSRIATYLSVNYFMTSLLERKDRMSMASGLEVRVPFGDHRILEYVFNVPWSIKFENNTEKALLRNAMKDYLPEKILWRKKSPYPKTHNPKYHESVSNILQNRIKSNKSILSEIMNKTALESLLSGENVTWFGQLMSTPQLLAWLIQFDYWFEKYKVKIV